MCWVCQLDQSSKIVSLAESERSLIWDWFGGIWFSWLKCFLKTPFSKFGIRLTCSKNTLTRNRVYYGNIQTWKVVTDIIWTKLSLLLCWRFYFCFWSIVFPIDVNRTSQQSWKWFNVVLAQNLQTNLETSLLICHVGILRCCADIQDKCINNF